MPFFQTCIMDGYFEDLLTVLDNSKKLLMIWDRKIRHANFSFGIL